MTIYKTDEETPAYRDAPKGVVAAVSGFTPCPDILVEKYSHTTALVWGKIWRYCQMKDGVCRASIQRLANELGLSDVTLEKHIKLLEKDGYVKDLTPDVRHKPHEYEDTGKLRLKISVFMDEDETEKAGTKKFGSRYQETLLKEATTNSSFALYESNIGPLTPMIADALQDAEKTYPPDWIKDAIALAVENNKRNWRYCETILKRWQAGGKDDGRGKPQAVTRSEYKTL